MLKMLCAALLLVLPLPALAQPAPTADMLAATRDAMLQISFLVGDWRGDGWIATGPGEPHRFDQTERIRALLNGEVLLIEGRGRASADTSQIIHDAVAFIGYDAAAGRYVMRSFLPGGRTTEATVEAGDGSLTWWIGENVRYTIRVGAAGHWHETGEYTRDGGRTWQQILEMRLVRTE